MNPGIIITARMGSKRLPGKVNFTLWDRTLLGVMTTRLKTHRVQYIPSIVVVATPDAQLCRRHPGKTFYGSESDVRERVIHCSYTYQLNPIIRLTGDCPFVDPTLISRCIRRFDEKNAKGKCELVGVACDRPEDEENCYPEGVDCEVVSLAALKDFGDEQPGDREHVTQHVKRRGKCELLRPEEDWSDVKLSIDTMEDYRQACLIAGRVGIEAGWREIAECARWWKQNTRA